MENLYPLVQLLKSEIIKELSLKIHSLGILHQGDVLIKSSSKHLFVVKKHSCEGLLRFVLLDDTVTVDIEVMTLTGVHVFRQDKHSSEKSFIPWSEENTLSSILEKG